MLLSTFLQHLAAILPPETAVKGDRIGLQLQSGREAISRVLVTMEVTDAVAEEAISHGADCILSFHPLIFSPLTALVNNERVGRICSRLVKHDIALVVAHTNFDAFPEGTSVLYAQHLGFTVERMLVPDALYTGFGMGIVATLPQSMAEHGLDERGLAAYLHGRSYAPIRFCGGSGAFIERVAIVGGSGASFIDHALAAGVQAFITADVKYHDFHRVQGTMALLDPGHYEMEQCVARGLASVVTTIAGRANEPMDVLRSAVLPNPVRYYPDTERYLSKQQEQM
jgi:dinuclear metal center YbgI/SA1388 family protein